MRILVLSCLVLSTIVVGCETRSSNVAPKNGKNPQEAVGTVTKPEPANVLLSDSFSGMSGSKVQHINGNLGNPTVGQTRMIFPFGGTSNEPSVLEAAEDTNTVGADGKPGVLRLTWQKVPSYLQYSGFSYNGSSQPLQPKLILNARTKKDLNNIILRFRYKGLNSIGGSPAYQIDCRIEPDAPNNFASRLDLKRITPTETWQEFSVRLGIGGNANAFLRAMESDSSAKLKIVWSQAGTISNYKAGDSLLIDDIAIVYSEPPVQTNWIESSTGQPATYTVARNYRPVEGLSSIDLSRFVSLPSNNFSGFRALPWAAAPHGDLNLAGIPLNISGATFLWGRQNAKHGDDYPVVIPQIPCEEAFESMYILQGGFYSSDEGLPVFDVLLNYSNETKKSIPLLYGSDVRDWYMRREPSEVLPKESRTILAWVADGLANGNAQRICFSLTEIRNPDPISVVDSIDLVSAKNDTAACILAITIGKSGMMNAAP